MLYVDHKTQTLEAVHINVNPIDSLDHMRVAYDHLAAQMGVLPRPDDATVQ